MSNLQTNYLGLPLKHPLVAGASPLSHEIGGIRQLEDGGAAAIVLHSLFEEQLTHEERALDHYLTQGAESYQEALSYFPEPDSFVLGPDEYLAHIHKAKAAVDVPVIASLNGVSTGGWVKFAKSIQQAGADALELNIYYVPTDLNMTSQMVEQMYVDVVKAVAGSVTIPLAVKMGAQFSAPVNMAGRLADAGAKGLVLFNRFYQPDIDLEELEVKPHLVLSTSYESRLPLRWIALLYGRVAADLAATSGVHTVEDALKMVMAGASAVQMASALLRQGPRKIGALVSEMNEWMVEHEYVSVLQMRGSLSQRNCAEPAAFERANYMKTLQSYSPSML